ncbi:hypothetical protein J1N35_011013 [Gossypium stocksii]|uniref:Uncharacterized protein n=1 Tax=Gossypium stocksii TaxID=47602 RepID=A0A9D3W3N5_9ROSI|nr:hypothetical protein J1N35_011013 [Gossypium stocksii]
MTIQILQDRQEQHQTVAKNTIPVPQVPIKIYLDKYSKPITIITFLDTGAVATIMNPDVLPVKWWKPYTAFFNSTANNLFATCLKSKPITIKFFLGCFVQTTVLGSKLPRKDIVIGFDLYSKAQKLRILPDGLRSKNQFQPFVQIPKLFTLQSDKISQIVQKLKDLACANSHTEFLAKCSNLLWKYLYFFISLPFKKNENFITILLLKKFLQLQKKYLCQLNRIVPIEIWPPPDIDTPWDTVLDGPYYQQILQALREYKAKIPDPSEWSQEYPMHCSQVEMERIRLHNNTL